MTNLKFTIRHSVFIIVILYLGIILGSLLIGYFIQRNPFFTAFDSYFYELIHKSLKSPVLDILIKPFNLNFLPSELSPGRMPSYYYFMILGCLGYLGFAKRKVFWWAVFCFVFGLLLAQIITDINWRFVFRQRPFLFLPNDVEESVKNVWVTYSSYPSGHARETTLLTTIIANFIPQLKWVILVFVIFIAYSRVYIGAHYPTDVIAGVAIGYLTAKVVLMIGRELQILWSRKGGKNNGKPVQEW